MDEFALNYIHNNADYDVAPHAERAVSLAVVNTGMLAQTQEHIAEYRQCEHIKFDCVQGAATGLNPSQLKRFEIVTPCNFIEFQISALSSYFYISINEEIRQCNGAAYGQYLMNSQSAPFRVSLPTRRSHVVNIYNLNSNINSFPFTDYVPLIFGYIPDANSRIILP